MRRLSPLLLVLTAALACNEHPVRGVNEAVVDPFPCYVAGPEIGDASSSSTCLRLCAADVDPETPLVDVNCRVVAQDEEGLSSAVPVCEAIDGVPTPPAGETLCHVLRSDDGEETPSASDDLSQACIDAGMNVELEIIHVGEPPALTIKAICQLADTCELDTACL